MRDECLTDFNKVEEITWKQITKWQKLLMWKVDNSKRQYYEKSINTTSMKEESTLGEKKTLIETWK